MQPGVLRILLARLSPPLFDLVLAGLLLAVLAALALAGPAIARWSFKPDTRVALMS